MHFAKLSGFAVKTAHLDWFEGAPMKAPLIAASTLLCLSACGTTPPDQFAYEHPVYLVMSAIGPDGLTHPADTATPEPISAILPGWLVILFGASAQHVLRSWRCSRMGEPSCRVKPQRPLSANSGHYALFADAGVTKKIPRRVLR